MTLASEKKQFVQWLDDGANPASSQLVHNATTLSNIL